MLENEIRPFVRAAREPVPDLRQAADRFSAAAPPLTTVAKKINRLGNMAAFNPNGAEASGTPGRDEGYLYWAGWLGHNGDTVFSSGDGNGFFRRIYFTVGCDQLLEMVEAVERRRADAEGDRHRPHRRHPNPPLPPVITGLS